MSNEIERDLKVLGKKHSKRVFDQISERGVMSSSEIVVESRMQPVQVYRVLEQLEAADLVRREEKSESARKPHVFWKLTKRGRFAKKLIQDYRRNVSKIKG